MVLLVEISFKEMLWKTSSSIMECAVVVLCALLKMSCLGKLVGCEWLLRLNLRVFFCWNSERFHFLPRKVLGALCVPVNSARAIHSPRVSLCQYQAYRFDLRLQKHLSCRRVIRKKGDCFNIFKISPALIDEQRLSL